jgi:transcriptional regulatory protein LevR
MELDDRLIILRDAKQIDEDIYSKILKIISMVKDEWSIELKEENGAMLITHLCIALQRIKNKNVVEKIDEDIYEEIKKNIYYEKGRQLLRDMEDEIGFLIPDCEKNFIIMHLCVLFEKENI